MEIILTGRKVPAEECARIGLCEYVVEDGGARDKAEELAHQIARFPQACVRADRRSARMQHGLPLRNALMQEWENSRRIPRQGDWVESDGHWGPSLNED